MQSSQAIGADNLPMSVCYNGSYICKTDLMIYINNLLRMNRLFDHMRADNKKRDTRIEGLKALTKRKQFYLPTRSAPQKPTGLSALSSSKRQKYEKELWDYNLWVSQEGDRRAILAQQEKEEDDRITNIYQEINQIRDEQFATINAMAELTELHRQEYEKQIISPDYRDPEILELLLSYLFNNRANTLTEAINLYHEEMHRRQVEQMLNKQSRFAELQLKTQQQMARDNMRAQLALIEEQRVTRQQQAQQAQLQLNAINEAKSVMKDIRFYEQMLYLQNL